VLTWLAAPGPRLPLAQSKAEAAAKAVFEAARKAGQAGQLLTPQELKAAAQEALRPKEQVGGRDPSVAAADGCRATA
jgi:hypothetical protein